MTALKLKPDTRLRKAWFVEEAMSHPAKGHLGLWWEILERYTQPGQWVLDPMAGIGSTLMGCLMGQNVVCNEMETHFLEPMLASWAKMQRVGPMLGHQMGQAVILRGDARALPLASADAIVTSPPYEGTRHDGCGLQEQLAREGAFHSYTRPVSAVVTSPPYEGIVGDHKEGPGAGANEERYGRWTKGTAKQNSYTQVDAVVTSPPWENNLASVNEQSKDYWSQVGGIRHVSKNHEYGTERPPYDHHSHGPKMHNRAATYNIGSLRSTAYWEAMAQVYRECHRVLIPGGVMVLVVKG